MGIPLTSPAAAGVRSVFCLNGAQFAAQAVWAFELANTMGDAQLARQSLFVMAFGGAAVVFVTVRGAPPSVSWLQRVGGHPRLPASAPADAVTEARYTYSGPRPLLYADARDAVLHGSDGLRGRGLALRVGDGRDGVVRGGDAGAPGACRPARGGHWQGERRPPHATSHGGRTVFSV